MLLRVNLGQHRDSSYNDSIGPLKLEQYERIVELSDRLVTLMYPLGEVVIHAMEVRFDAKVRRKRRSKREEKIIIIEIKGPH